MEVERFNGLLRLVDIGDESAVDKLRTEYGGKIRWVAYSILDDWHYAEDILIAVMKTLWNKSRKFQNIQNPDACIYDLAKKESYTFYRKYLKKIKNEVSIEIVAEKEASQFLVHIDEHSELEFLSRISCLNKIEREIITKKLVLKSTHAEIAADLGVPESTLRGKYQQILEKMRKKIKEEKDSS